MFVREKEFRVPAPSEWQSFPHELAAICQSECGPGNEVVRFIVTSSRGDTWRCEVAIAEEVRSRWAPDSIFRFRKRLVRSTDSFCAVFLVPTGIGAEIGGHAGDSTAAARLIANACDRILLHPNVVNGSDLNEMPTNALYVEGSVLTRFLMGTIGLQPSTSNRVLVVIDDHPDRHFTNAAINTVNAGRATYGLDCPEIFLMRPSIQLWGGKYSKSGRAVGEARGLERILSLIQKKAGTFDVVALSSVINVPANYHLDYFKSEGRMVNPWGGVEAMLTHMLSSSLNVQTAHAPMFESRDIENLETGIVEPRMSAEAVSMTFFQCVLKGLHTSPKIITQNDAFGKWGVLSVENVSCLILPDGCVGLPTLAALEQGIPVISVRENRNIMHNDLSHLPWGPNQFFPVENYIEAAGVINLLKSGVTVASVRRPISISTVSEFNAEERIESNSEIREAEQNTG